MRKWFPQDPIVAMEMGCRVHLEGFLDPGLDLKTNLSVVFLYYIHAISTRVKLSLYANLFSKLLTDFQSFSNVLQALLKSSYLCTMLSNLGPQVQVILCNRII